MSKHKKVAMVQPAATRPAKRRGNGRLPELLAMFGNDRAYTVISVSPGRWVIHFEGDVDHTVIRMEGEKPVMIKE